MRWFLLFLMACVFRTSTPPPAGGQGGGSDRSWRPDATNVLVVVLDDVGTNAVRAYKEVEDLPRTPRIDRLARDGVLFRNAYSAPVCSGARAALLTGRYGRRTGLGEAISSKSADALALAEITLPEMLERAEADWSTAALGKWHLAGREFPGWTRHPLEQGFDTHKGSAANLTRPSPDGRPTGGYEDFDKLVDGVLTEETTYATTDTTNDALNTIRDLREPWLTWVAYNGAHDPFHTPPARLLKEPLGPDPTRHEQFRAMVESVDDELGRLLDGIPPQVLARTMIVVIGDNGTPPQVVPPPFNGREAKFTLFEGGTNVPFVVSGAGVQARGTESDALVHVVDLFPTVARVAGVKTSSLKRGGKPVILDGLPLQPLLADPTADWSRKTLFTERFAPNGAGPYTLEYVAVRDRRFKWMEVHEEGKASETYLFDLKGKVTDGENLLDGPLDERAQKARDRLKAELATYRRIRTENP